MTLDSFTHIGSPSKCDTVCFRVFDDKKGGVFQGAKLSCECGKYKSIEETLKNHNAMNRGIFFVVNYGGADDDSITRALEGSKIRYHGIPVMLRKGRGIIAAMLHENTRSHDLIDALFRAR